MTYKTQNNYSQWEFLIETGFLISFYHFIVVFARPFQGWKLNDKETIKGSRTTVTFSYPFYLPACHTTWNNERSIFFNFKKGLKKTIPFQFSLNPSKFSSLWLVDHPSSIRMKWNFPLKANFKGESINHSATSSVGATSTNSTKASTLSTD